MSHARRRQLAEQASNRESLGGTVAGHFLIFILFHDCKQASPENTIVSRHAKRQNQRQAAAKARPQVFSNLQFQTFKSENFRNLKLHEIPFR